MQNIHNFLLLFTVFNGCHGAKIVYEMNMAEVEDEEVFHMGQKQSVIGQSQIDQESARRSGVTGKFSFASYYGDNMVLQGIPNKAKIWGYAPEDSNDKTVRVQLSPGNETFNTIVTPDLTWTVQIGPVSPGGPYKIIAYLGTVKLTLNNVMFGDVWICSGQSNMAFPLTNVFNSTEEVKDTVNYPDIRLFVVKENTSTTPLSDFTQNGILLPWSISKPDTINGSKFSAVCWLYGKHLYQKLKRPIGLVETSVGGTPVEAWSSKDALHKCGLESVNYIKPTPDPDPIDGIEGPSEYSVLWNAMVHPFINMTVYGAIWYQGENNAQHFRDKYNCTFPAMIDNWRLKFSTSGTTNSLFPFGFVQLAGYRPDHTISTGFTDIRWHQTADYGYVPNHRLRNVFMAVAMDLPDFTSPYSPVHPRDKQDVAARLALGGLAIGYNMNVSYQGPYPVHVEITHAVQPYKYTQVLIEYTSDLEQRWLDGFEICCAFEDPPVCVPGKSWWLPTTTMQGYDQGNATLSYASECSVDNVVGIRYAWRESPCPFKNCAIYGANNELPMPPFTYYGEAFKKIRIKENMYTVSLL
ncbi:hypothetical protein ACF0H5_015454 [Mactra antiquata]